MALRSYPVEEMKRLAEKDRREEEDELVALWAELNDGQDLRATSGWGHAVRWAIAWGNKIREEYEEELS